MNRKIVLFWFRRDLRLEDNVGLCHALNSDFPVFPIFIFDTTILNRLENKRDRRVDYIHQALTTINSELHLQGSQLQTFLGEPMAVVKSLLEQFDIQAVYCNRDYEPEAIQRDTEIHTFLKTKNIPFKAYKDQVIFDKNDVLKKDGNPYTVFTPYSKTWQANLSPSHYQEMKSEVNNFFKSKAKPILSLEEIGFEKTDMVFTTPTLDVNLIANYDTQRDIPSVEGTTRLGVALRFGTISIRKCVACALEHNQVWLSELIWREFFMQILYHFPHVTSGSFKKKYDFIPWRNDEKEFELWCQGKTGYPIVDAGMRQLNQTGYMHNRIRMIVASFLCKHLLIDWRWGEAYFAEKLNDYDLAANNGNWQWAAGSGCDAAPYFRIFNPWRQTERFDPNQDYIKNWVPEFETEDYPEPMVAHKLARERALQVYRKALQPQS